MKVPRLTEIDLVGDAVSAGKSRTVTASLQTLVKVSSRSQRGHKLLAGMEHGQSRHIASMGELSLHDCAAAIVEHYGPFECLTLSTWAASEESIKRLLDIRTAGGVRRIEALVDSRMPTDCADAHALMVTAFDAYRAGANHSKVMAFTRPNMLAWNGIFALGCYVPMLSMTFQKKAQDSADMSHSRRVYAFKQQGKHLDEFKNAVESLKSHFKCDDIVAVPRSTLEASRLQELFGVKFERTMEVTPRKANHRSPLVPQYAQTYTLHRERVTGPRVLLIDDIVTTGVTLAHFAQDLRAAGFTVIPAALAIDHKLPATWTSPGIAIVSTANLTHNPRCEVMDVVMSSAVAEFHRDWIREEITRVQ